MLEKTVIILSVGRTGSSLLRSILNQTINNAFIQGENFFCTWWLFKFHECITREIVNYTNGFDIYKDERNPFFARIQKREVETELRDLIVKSITHGKDIRVCGFKEIRWEEYSRGSVDAVIQYIDFLAEYLPDIHLVISTRSPKEIANSAWWKQDSTPINVLEEKQNWLLQICEKNVKSLVVDYEAVKHNELSALFDFLGEDYQPQKIEQLLKIKHSF